MCQTGWEQFLNQTEIESSTNSCLKNSCSSAAIDLYVRGFQPDCAYYRSYNVLTLFHAPPDPRPLYRQTLLAWGFSTCLASCLAFGIGDMDHTNGHEDNEFVVSKNTELVLWLFRLSTYFRRMVSESLSCISSSVGVFLNNFVNCPILKDFVLLSEIEVLINVCACRLGIPRDEGTGSTRPRSFLSLFSSLRRHCPRSISIICII